MPWWGWLVIAAACLGALAAGVVVFWSRILRMGGWL